jgi:hypothetical protein
MRVACAAATRRSSASGRARSAAQPYTERTTEQRSMPCRCAAARIGAAAYRA